MLQGSAKQKLPAGQQSPSGVEAPPNQQVKALHKSDIDLAFNVVASAPINKVINSSMKKFSYITISDFYYSTYNE